VPAQTVNGHPASALYRLLVGDVTSKRDQIVAGRAVTSLFVMEIAPRGTNFPHHHEREEEIYLVLSGHGESWRAVALTVSKASIPLRQATLIFSGSIAPWATTVLLALKREYLPSGRGIPDWQKKIRSTSPCTAPPYSMHVFNRG
jgi:hypothetical protein